MSEIIKTPPHSIEAEQSVIGGLLLDPNTWEKVESKLKADDFYRKDHRELFSTICELEAKNQPFDAVTINQYLKDNNQGIDLIYLSRLAKDTPSASNITAYADIVREKSILRQLIATGTKITSRSFSPDGLSAHELIDAAEKEVYRLSDQTKNIDIGALQLSNSITQALSDLDVRQNNPGALNGIASGFKSFDKKTAGLHKSDLIILAARPSMGKTTLAMNIVEHVASSGAGALVFSMEMSRKQLVDRQIVTTANIDFQQYRTGSLSEDDWKKITNATSKLHSTRIYIDDSPNLSVSEVRSRSRKAMRKHGIDLIVIDYLQLMKGKGENRTQEIRDVSQGLKALAKEINVPVIALSQLNRSLENRPNKRPIMSDLRESGDIEQDADLIAFIYRDEIYNEETELKGIAELIIRKQRNGPTGTVYLSFKGENLRFNNFSGPLPTQEANCKTRRNSGFQYNK